MSPDNRIRVYKSLETDGEFRDRLQQKYGRFIYETGVQLDDYAWVCWGAQRRIIERTAGASPS